MLFSLLLNDRGVPFLQHFAHLEYLGIQELKLRVNLEI